MIKENIKKLLLGILIVSLLLCVCISIDYADDNTSINNIDDSLLEINDSNIKVYNNASIRGANESGSYFIAKNSDKIHTIREKSKGKVKKLPTISMWAKPSCGCRYSYTWHKYTFINYCPHCGKYGTLRKNPKGVYEQEYTCAVDDCDYCAVCGKEKMSYSKYYLRKA